MNQSLTLKKNDGITDVIYQLRSAMGASAEWMDPTTSAAAPRLLKVSHAMKAVGGKGSDRHTVLNQLVLLDSLNIPQIVSVSTTITVPRSPVVTTTLIKDEVALNRHYLSMTGVIDAIIDGIIP